MNLIGFAAMFTRSFFITTGLLIIASLLALNPIDRFPVTENEAGRLETVRSLHNNTSEWKVEQGLSTLIVTALSGNPNTPTAHSRLRRLSWLGFVVSGILLCLLWNQWGWPIWSVATMWCVAAILPGAWPTLQTVPLLSWTLALVLASVFLRIGCPHVVAALATAVIWAFLLWWAPDFWPFWICAYAWIVLIGNPEARGKMVLVYSLSILAGVVTVFLHSQTENTIWSARLPESEDIHRQVEELFMQAPLLVPIVLIGLLDAAQGKANPNESSRASFPLVGALLSFLWIDFDAVSSLILVTGCAASSIWWMRMYSTVPGPTLRILCGVVLFTALLPIQAIFREASQTTEEQRTVFDLLDEDSARKAPFIDETFTVYFRDSLLDDQRKHFSGQRLKSLTTIATGLQLHPGAYWYLLPPSSESTNGAQTEDPKLYGLEFVRDRLWQVPVREVTR